ncbi:hypothetical protein [Methylobacter marinus]|uniref:hypothetical protein n=1 Tax=Methylobacter marinus TaxID=34058 RepID=UPI00035EB786|nr:hypothetical protein [Methylobacter marinus]
MIDLMPKGIKSKLECGGPAQRNCTSPFNAAIASQAMSRQLFNKLRLFDSLNNKWFVVFIFMAQVAGSGNITEPTKSMGKTVSA